MESANNGDFNYTKDGFSKPPKRTSKAWSLVKKAFKKFWYIVAIVVIIIAGLITMLVLENNKTAAWNKASDYFAKADYESAEKLIDNYSIPNDAARQRVYAQTMLATGKLDKALAGYEKLYDTTKDTSAKLIIGNIYNQQEKYDQAIAIYREIIAANSSNVQAYVNLATVYRLQSKNDDAIKIANEAVQKNPKNITLLELKISMLLENQNSAEYKKAVADLKAIAPEDPLLKALNEQ